MIESNYQYVPRLVSHYVNAYDLDNREECYRARSYALELVGAIQRILTALNRQLAREQEKLAHTRHNVQRMQRWLDEAGEGMSPRDM